MKLLFVLLFLGLGLNVGIAQQWNGIEQASLGVSYDLPQAWYVGGHARQKACVCIGAAVNSSSEGALGMMVVVGEDTDADFLKQPIWNYEFVETDSPPKQIVLENILFQESISTWKQSPKEVVLRFVGQAPDNNRTYVLYFWGALEDIQQYSSAIERIVRSFQPL